jgi:hypothetical protein
MSITSIRPSRKIPEIKKYLIFGSIFIVLFLALYLNQERIPDILGISKKAKLSITASENGSKVYVFDKYIGETPIDSADIRAGLVNISIKGSKNTYNTSLNIVDKSENNIYRDLGINKELSSGINIWEGTPDDKKVELFLSPENSKVTVNDKEVTLNEVSSLDEGEYKFNISSDGYRDSSFTINVRKNYKTNIDIKLAPLPNTKDIENLSSYENIYSIYSNNSDVFYNSKDWLDYFIYVTKKKGFVMKDQGLVKDSFFDYFVDYDGRIFDRNGVQIDTLNSIDNPESKKVGLLNRSVDKGKLNDRSFKSLLFFNSKVSLTDTAISTDTKFSAKIASLTNQNVAVNTGNVLGLTSTQPAQAVAVTSPAPKVIIKNVVIKNEWLRVRKTPNGEEMIKVNQNEQYPYVSETPDGWVKIQLPNGTQGFVSKQFVIIN